MTDLRKAAEMALEALESLDCGDTYKTHNAASALRQALSTPEKPDTWVGLTEEEFDQTVPYCHNEFDLNDFKDFARAIEAKLKEKNRE
jgi:hypothetical protein